MTDTHESSGPFPGFDLPDSGWVKLPQALINRLADITTLAELKVLLYVLRHTWGYGDYTGGRRITLDEFTHGRKRRDGSRVDPGTGLSPNAIKAGVRAAIEHGYLLRDSDGRDAARNSHIYRLRVRSAAAADRPAGAADGRQGLSLSPVDRSGRQESLPSATDKPGHQGSLPPVVDRPGHQGALPSATDRSGYQELPPKEGGQHWPLDFGLPEGASWTQEMSEFDMRSGLDALKDALRERYSFPGAPCADAGERAQSFPEDAEDSRNAGRPAPEDRDIDRRFAYPPLTPPAGVRSAEFVRDRDAARAEAGLGPWEANRFVQEWRDTHPAAPYEEIMSLGQALESELGMRPDWTYKVEINSWLSGLQRVLRTADGDEELVVEVALEMREDGLAIPEPHSLVKMVRDAAARGRRPHEGGTPVNWLN